MSAMGILGVIHKDQATAAAVVIGIGAVLQQFGAQRSRDKQADASAAVENTKTITAAATADKKTEAAAAGGITQ